MKNPIIGFCRVKDVKYNQFERPNDAFEGMWYEMGAVDRSNYDTDREYLEADKRGRGQSNRNESQTYYANNYADVSPYFGKVVPLSYSYGGYAIHPNVAGSTYNTLDSGISIPLQWVEILTAYQAFDSEIGGLYFFDMLEEPGIMFSKTSPIHISISTDSICGVHYVEKIQDGKVVDYGFISKSDLREIYGNIGAILGAKK